MEAKETVIKPGELGLAIIKHPELPMGQAISIEQAEISFKAGIAEKEQECKDIRTLDWANWDMQKCKDVEKAKKVGIREVVEWLEKYKSDTEGYFHYSFGGSDLHAKLKEWGIE